MLCSRRNRVNAFCSLSREWFSKAFRRESSGRQKKGKDGACGHPNAPIDFTKAAAVVAANIVAFLTLKHAVNRRQTPLTAAFVVSLINSLMPLLCA
jgi:hypothetical protein